MMNRTVKQKCIQSREKALKNTEVPKKKKNLLESFRKTNTAYVPCYKKKAFEIADRPVATLQLWSQSTSLRNGPDYRIQQICDN